MAGPIVPLNILISALAGSMAGVTGAVSGLDAVAAAAKKAAAATGDIAAKSAAVPPLLSSIAKSLTGVGASAPGVKSASEAMKDMAKNMATTPSLMNAAALAAQNFARQAPNLNAIARQFLNIKTAAGAMFVAVGAGIGIGIGNKLVDGFLALGTAAANAFGAIVTGMENVIKTGLAFDLQMESSTLAIAAILRSTDKAGNFETFGKAMKAADAIMGQMKVGALNSAADLQGLVLGFQTSAAAMAEANIPLSKQVDLTILMGSAIKALLGPMNNERQIVTEMRAALEGLAVPGASLARFIFRTAGDKQAFEQAKANGTAFEFFTLKLRGFDEAAKVASGTMGLLVSNLGDLKQQIAGAFAVPVFEELKAQASAFTTFLLSGDVTRAFDPLGAAIATGVQAIGTNLLKLLPIANGIVGTMAPIFVAAGKGITDASEIVGEKLDELQALFDNPNFARAWATAMESLGFILLDLAVPIDRLIRAFGDLAISVVKALPDLVRLAEAVTPLFVLMAEGVAHLAGGFVTLTEKIRAFLTLESALGAFLFNMAKSPAGLAKNFDELIERLKAAKLEAGKTLLDNTKPNPKAVPENLQEEAVKSQQSIGKLTLQLQEVENKAIQDNERLSHAKRLEEQNAFFELRRQAILDASDLENEAIRLAAIKATPEAKVSLATRQETANKQFELDNKKLQAEIDEYRRKNAIVEADRQEKIRQAATLRADELALNLANAAGDQLAVGNLQRKIDLERETIKIMEEQGSTRARLNEADYGAARTKAQAQAQETINAKDANANAAKLVALRAQLDAESDLNRLGAEGARVAQENAAIAKIMDDAERISLATKGESVRLATLLTEEMRKQNALQAAIREFAADKAKSEAAGAREQTAVLRAQTNRNLSPDQKEAVERKGIEDQIARTRQLITMQREFQQTRQLGIDPLGFAESDRIIEELIQNVLVLERSLETVGTTAGKVKGAILDWADSFGSIGDQLARFTTGSMSTVMNKVSEGIYQMAVAGQTFKQSMFQALDAVSQKFIQMTVEFITQKLVLMAFQRTFNAGMLATDAATAGALTAVWTPAAVMKSIATMGIAAIVGFAIFAAIAGAAGAFAEGGIVPGAPSRKDNRLAMVASGEAITQAPAVTYYGERFFTALNEMKIPKDRIYAALAGIELPTSARSTASRFAGGGLVEDVSPGGGGLSVKPADIHIGILRDKTDIRAWFESTEGQKVLIKAMDANRLG